MYARLADGCTTQQLEILITALRPEQHLKIYPMTMYARCAE